MTNDPDVKFLQEEPLVIDLLKNEPGTYNLFIQSDEFTWVRRLVITK